MYSTYNLNNTISYLVSQIQSIIIPIIPFIAYKNQANTFTESQNFVNIDVATINQNPIPVSLNPTTSGTATSYQLTDGILKTYLVTFNNANGNVVLNLPSDTFISSCRDTFTINTTTGSLGSIVFTITSITIPSCVNLNGVMLFYAV
jgi:hypothetical protein